MPNLLKYDVIYILDPMATAEEMAAVSAKVEQVLNDAKGTVLKKDEWGKRRLAYPVKKHREGLYVFYHVSIPPESVSEITRNLRLLEKVIKYSVVKDTISHLKPKPKPIRTGTPRTPSTEGPGHRSGGHRAPAPPLSAPAAPAPGSSSTASSTEPTNP